MKLETANSILSKMNPADAKYPLIEVDAKHVTVRAPYEIPYELSPGESVEAALDKLFASEIFAPFLHEPGAEVVTDVPPVVAPKAGKPKKETVNGGADEVRD